MNSRVVNSSGAIVISILVCVAFGVTLFLSLENPDSKAIGQALDILIGAVVANFTTVVTFWCGSSSESQRKSEMLAAQMPNGSKPEPKP